MTEVPSCTYEGKPCVKCGSTVRYKATYRCVECAKQYKKDYVKKRAMENESKNLADPGPWTDVPTGKYHAKECEKCGGTIRYVSNGNCVHCQNNRRYVTDKELVEKRRRAEEMLEDKEGCFIDD